MISNSSEVRVRGASLDVRRSKASFAQECFWYLAIIF
jgi:hypothetical protein